MSERKLYRKANSFLEIRRRDRDTEPVRERIARVAEKTRGDDYFSRIVATACSDLLADPSTKPAFQLLTHVEEEIHRLSDENLPRYLFYRYRYDNFPKDHRIDDFPPCLQIEPTSICNFRCVFCYQTDKEFTDKKNGHMGHMPIELFKQVVDQAQGKVEAVTLASRGDPFMARGIEEMLDYVRGKFLALKINTNASILNERQAHTLLSSEANTIVFSADAAEEPLYSQLRVNGKLDKVLANVRQFQEIRTKHYSGSKTITRVSGVRFSRDQSIDSMDRVWGELVDQVAFVDYNPWENVYGAPTNNITEPCSDLWRRTFVWWDGRVNPCDSDFKSHLAVGNVKDTDLSSLWTGAKYQAYREAHLSNRRSTLTPCGQCTVL